MLFLALLFLSSAEAFTIQDCIDGISVKEKAFNFQSPAYPGSLPNEEAFLCKLRIEHPTGENEHCNEDESDDNENVLDQTSTKICQVRLDFLEFALQPPLLGNCQYDKMWVSANGKYPLLCGENAGHHIYLDVAGKSHTDITFQIDALRHQLYSCPDRFNLTGNSDFFSSIHLPVLNRNAIKVNVQADEQIHHVNFTTRRAWNIDVNQIPCGCSPPNQGPRKAPNGCLSFYAGISGSFKSFNYDSIGCYSHDFVCDEKRLDDCSLSAGYTGHLNNLDYTICIEQEYGFCGMEYSEAPNEMGAFTLTNKTELKIESDEKSMRMNTGASSGDDHCLTDYLVLPGAHCKGDAEHYSTDRFCGNSLGVNGMSLPIVQYSAPFNFQVVTDKDELSGSVDYMNRGFHLRFNQIPCR